MQKTMSQSNDDGVLPCSVITRENYVQSSISTISEEFEKVKAVSIRDASTQSSISTLSLEVEEEANVVGSAGSNKVIPIGVSSTIISNESVEGRIRIIYFEY